MITFKAFHRSPKLAEFKVSYKRGKGRKAGRPSSPTAIAAPQSAAEYLRSVWNRDTIELVEDFVVLCLNTAHEPLGWIRLFTGGFDAAIVDPRVVFAIALQTASAAIIVAHNHPSGSLKPSAHDIALTRQLRKGGELLRIPVLDHIILTRDAAFSFADGGLLTGEV